MVLRGWARPTALLALLLALPVIVSGADVIFRVPTVMVRQEAVAKPVGTGSSNPSRGNPTSLGQDEGPRSHETLELRYEEYFVEHEISTAAARKAAKELRVEDVPVSLVGCGSCSRREVEYCEARVVADHCCCERGFVPEPLPWLPHTCYLGAAACRPTAGDCARYKRLRDCCCLHRLASKWKGILSKSTRPSAAYIVHLAVFAALAQFVQEVL